MWAYTMLEPFFLGQYPDSIENQWRQKHLIACEIMGKTPLRTLRPDLKGDRARLDLMWNGKQLGIRGPSTSAQEFPFFAIENPDTPTQAIREMLLMFQDDPPPLELAQVRFRSGMTNSELQKPILGLWFDTSNESILRFLEEGRWLQRWMESGVVIEVGQKQKEVSTDPSRGLKLAPAKPRAWLPSFDIHNKSIPLISRICQFSQPGEEANRALFAASFELIDENKVPAPIEWVEWGAGYGNLTAGFYTRLGPQGVASEIDPGAAECLALNRDSNFAGIETLCQAAENDGLNPHFKPEFWLIDPPRPGFPKLLEKLQTAETHKPEYVFALHCHSSGLISDSSALRKANYKNLGWSSVDTFPATPHFEVLSLWKKE
jgi:hypothetical protein